MKKILITIAIVIATSIISNAQILASLANGVSGNNEMLSSQQNTVDVSETFEGEIVFETFESYCEWIKKMPNSIYVDGVHKMRLLVKGDKMHLIDETTKCHILVNNSYTHFCEITKTGFSMDYYDFMLVAAPRTLNYGNGQTAELTFNSFAKTTQTDTIMGRECVLWIGDVVHEMGGKLQKYSCHAYCSDIKVPYAYTIHLLGMPLESIATKWIIKYDGGHESTMGVGELSYYMEGDVTSITPRPVSDDELCVPSNYKITKGSIKTAMSMMKYYNGVKKSLEKAGIKGENHTAKTTGVHFKTQEEWDY